MKIALSWILDHISVTKKELDVQSLAQSFNDTTAEVDDVKTVHTDLASLYAVRITEIADELLVGSPERKGEIRLPLRKDPLKNAWYLMKQDVTS